jgi:hypothetical protein
MSRLTEGEVITIRDEYKKDKVGYRVLASKYGVTYGAIAHIITGKSWKHLLDGTIPIAPGAPVLPVRRTPKPRTKLSDEDVGNMRQEHTMGVSVRKLAKKYGLSIRQTGYILKGEARKFPTPPLPTSLPHP